MGSGAWVPAHLTGLFEIVDSNPDPLRRGSRGAGVNLALGIETWVVHDPRFSGVAVEINGRPSSNALVSISTANELLRLSKGPGGLRIKHLVPVPIGSGFGTSGAAALGVAIAGSRELSLNLPPVRAAALAHRIEIKHRTGLGTVAGEFVGGLEVRVTPGAPGVGKAIRIPIRRPMKVVAVHNGPLSTERILGDPVIRRRINHIGRNMMEELLKKLTPERFIELSHLFALRLNLGPENAMEALRKAAAGGLYIGMAMFGKTYFTVVEDGAVRKALETMKELLPSARTIVAPISLSGAKAD